MHFYSFMRDLNLALANPLNGRGRNLSGVTNKGLTSCQTCIHSTVFMRDMNSSVVCVLHSICCITL